MAEQLFCKQLVGGSIPFAGSKFVCIRDRRRLRSLFWALPHSATAMDDPTSTADRLLRVQLAALELAEVVEDLVRDVEAVALNMPARTKRTHELALATRARELARAVRTAVADTRQSGALERRRRADRRQEAKAGPEASTAGERRSAATERRQRERRR
jgi:hypothetical protein